jgi:hypothetical protein
VEEMVIKVAGAAPSGGVELNGRPARRVGAGEYKVLL